jgi:hypothetical protein
MKLFLAGNSVSLVRVRFVRAIFALALLAMWPMVTCHSLLETTEMIHLDEHSDHHQDGGGKDQDHDSDHDFADGNYFSKTTQDSVNGFDRVLLFQSVWLAAILPDLSTLEMPLEGPAPPGVAPPDLIHCWNFVHRTALAARAPSIS